MATPDSERIEELTRAANELIREVDSINKTSGERVDILAQDAKRLAKDAKRSKRVTIALSVIVGVLVILAPLVVIALRSTIQITSRLDSASTTSRQKALCPLYEVFLASDTKEARKAAPDPAARDRAFVVIRSGYEALGCKEFKGSVPELGR